ncbi:hypothetical protein HYDPIDRAFT_183811 [Hydnomerulius pinastri MD-312]|uniref:Auxin efflux carrier n=1 Tax=Hydnomerulius pinastri MD-312 TaxID=994086 RepID=A0A0C9VQD7_9AGAM|nr:hypothetical protein HYDPIDRAFT_183811 [Hydnomerulius pinastri MD-312]
MIHVAGTPVLPLLFTVFQSIFQVFLLCISGYILSSKGIVDKRISNALNHINIALFTPALLFSKVAFFLTPAKLRELWVIPIFFVVVTGLSGIVANWLARACRLKRSQVNFATAASMFMNSNSLPIALMQSLVSTVPGLKWGEEDNKDAMLGRALTYLVVFSTLGMMLRWSYGIRLLSQTDDDEPNSPSRSHSHADEEDARRPLFDHDREEEEGQYRDGNAEGDAEGAHASIERPVKTPTGRLINYHASSSEIWDQDQHDTHDPDRPHMRGQLPVPSTMLGVDSNMSTPLDSDEDSEETLAVRSLSVSSEAGCQSQQVPPVPGPGSSSSPSSRTSNYSSPLPRLLTSSLRILTSLSPPFLASVLAIIVAVLPPLQDALNSQALTPVRGALDGAGSCSIPLTLIVLGGWFWDDGEGGKKKDVEVPRVVVRGADEGNNQHDHQQEHDEGRLRGSQSPSRNSSSGSLSSLLSAFGDMMMSKVRHRPRSHASELPTHYDTSSVSHHRTTTASRSPRTTGNGTSSPHPHPQQNRQRETGKSSNPKGESLTIFVTLLARMIVVPALLLPLMVLLRQRAAGGADAGVDEGEMGGVFDDPVFVVSVVLLIASPPALTLAQISQRASASSSRTKPGANADSETQNSPFERLLSRTVFWAYCVLTPPVTIGCVLVGMIVVGM